MNEIIKKYGALSSSVDPEKLSTTVIATAKTLSGILVFAGVLTVADETTLLTQVPVIINSILALVPLAFAMWHAGEIVFGVFQKILVSIGKMLAARKAIALARRGFPVA